MQHWTRNAARVARKQKFRAAPRADAQLTGNRSADPREIEILFQRSSSSSSSRVIAGAPAPPSAASASARLCCLEREDALLDGVGARPAGRPSPGASGRCGARGRRPDPRPPGSTTGSRRNTLSAAVRLRPVPPARSETSITGGPLSLWNCATTAARSRVDAVEAHERQVRVAQHAARRGRAATSTARTRAPCGPRRPPPRGSRAAPRASPSARSRAPGTRPGGRRPGAAAAAPRAPGTRCRPRRSARRRPRASRRGPRRRPRARRRASSTCSTTSVRGGSSGATSRFSRRSTNGRMRARSRSAAAGVARGDRPRIALVEVARPPSQPRDRKWNWLHSSSSRFSTGVPVSASAEPAGQAMRRARDLAVGVLDRLRLVEHDAVPVDRARARRRRAAGARSS